MEITLTVQSAGKNKWRLGLSTADSIEKFTRLEYVKFILSINLETDCYAVCGTSKKKAYDFNGKELS